jgi:uncharacterized protein with GYD domain
MMAKYISLISWTDQGIKNFRDTVDRAHAAQKAAEQLGGSLTVYWTVGPYDIVAMSEFPDDESATAFLLNIGSLGNIRTTTLRAYDESDMQRILQKA